MAIVSLDLFKKHVRADDFADDDEYMQHLIDTASADIIRATARTEEELMDIGAGEIPLQLRHAVLLLAGHWYNQRESVSTVQMHEVPATVQALIRPYRKLSGLYAGR